MKSRFGTSQSMPEMQYNGSSSPATDSSYNSYNSHNSHNYSRNVTHHRQNSPNRPNRAAPQKHSPFGQITARSHSRPQSHNSRINNVNNRSNSHNLFTRDRPLLPSMSNDSLLNVNSFSSRVTQVRNIIEWLDEQEMIFQKLKTPNELEIIENEIKSVYSTINTAFDDLNILLKNQTKSFKQDKARLLSLKKQYANTEQKLSRLLRQSSKCIKIRKQREELFAGAKGNSKKHSIHDELASLESSHQIIESTLQIVQNVKNELWSQKGLLTQTKNKLLNMTNLVGFSNSIIRVITQRSTVDQWILIGGMCLTLFIIFLIWWFLM